MEIKSKKQLCKGYGITYPTLNRRLKMIKGLKLKRFDKMIFPAELEKIYQVYGNPFKETEKK